jgi:hypothetical protein
MAGPRSGRFDRDGTSNVTLGRSPTPVTLGPFILFFGRFGFNPGSTPTATDLRIAVIALHTFLTGAAGVVAAPHFNLFRCAEQLQGIEVEIILPKGEGLVDLLLSGNCIVKTEAWDNSENPNQKIRQRILSDLRCALLVEFKGRIPKEAQELLERLARDAHCRGGMGWIMLPWEG